MRFLALAWLLVLASCREARREEPPFPKPAPRMHSEWYEPGKRLKRQVELLALGDGTLVKDGAERIWYPDGTLRWERYFERDVPRGTWLSFHPNGELATRVEIESSTGLGLMQRFHPNGSLAAEGTGRGALPEGPWRIFHPDGTLAEEGPYVAGKKHGAWRYWNEDGQLTAEGEYEAGERVGRWRLLNRDGVWVERTAVPAIERPTPERVQ